MKKNESAKYYFDHGYNCAQSVLKPFAKQLKFDAESALKLSSGFGAGMGRTQQTCGALTGAYMVLGMKFGKEFPDDDSREKVIETIQEFTRQFKEKHKFIHCSELLKVDLKTNEGQQMFTQQNLHEQVCSKCVNTSISMLEDLMDDNL